MSRLYDRARNVWVDVPENEVTPLVQKGTHAFETGIDIPVVSPDGTIGSIKSDDAERAFKDEGYRWQTQEDIRQFEGAQKEAILQKQYGENNLINAATQGVLRGYVPGADLAMQGLGAIVGEGDAVREGLQETKERNPIAATAGQIAGTLANPLLMGAGNAANAAGTAAGARLVGGIAEAGTAGRIAAQIAPKAVGSAVEGAFFGLGDGINEAALGNPDEIAQNLMAGPLMGVVLGGGFGAAFAGGQMAATPLKGLIEKTVAATSDATGAAMRGAARNTLVPALTLKGEKELVQLTREMTDAGSAKVRDAYYFGGKEAADAARKEVLSLESVAQEKTRGLKKELDYFLKSRPKDIRAQIAQDLESTQGNITEALGETFSRYKGERETLEAALRADQTPSQIAGLFDEETSKFISSLEKSGDPRAVRKAAQIREYVEAQQVANTTRYATAAGEGAVPGLTTPSSIMRTEGRDMLLGNELRDLARSGIGKLNGDAQKVVNGYVDDLGYLLKNHPKYGEEFARLDKFYDSFDGFRSFASGVNKVPDTNVKRTILDKVRNNPEFAEKFDGLLNHLGEVAPEMEAYRSAGRNLADKESALRQIENKLKSVTDRASGRMDIDDLEEAVQAFSAPDMMSKVEDLRNLSAELKVNGEGVFTKALRLQKALGIDNTAEFKRFASLETERGFASLDKLDPERGASNEYIKQLVGHLAKKAFRGVVGYEVGDLVGGTPGAMIGAVAANGGVNPARVLKALTILERQSNKSFQAIEAASKRAVDVLTKDSVRQVANVALAQNRRPLKERREDFKERSEFLTSLKNPETRLQAIEQRVGQIPGAPNVQASIASQFSKTADFLVSKLPVDPLAGQGLMQSKSPWTPSDYELGKFERYVDAAENPMSVLDHIAKGTVGPEEIETLQVLYPSMYKRLQKDVVNAIMEPNTKLSYKQRLNIGTLLNLPADATMTPSFVNAMQQGLNTDTGGRPKGSSSSSSAPRPKALDIDTKATQTSVQRISDR